MENDTLSFGLSTASRTYPSRRKSHFAELLIDFEEVDGDDELRTAYPCPFCVDDFDLLLLCCHIDLDHPIEASSGIFCPVCAMWLGTNMIEHMTAQHGSIFRSLLKSKRYKHDSYSTLPFTRKGQEDGPCQSFSDGLSPVMSTSKSARDPLMSFLYGGAAADECENVCPESASEVSIEEIQSDEIVLERDVQPSLSDKDQIEKARHSKFVQGLLMSTILDPDF